MEGEIDLRHGIKGAQIRLNQYNNITTSALNVFTSLKDPFKPFLTFTTYSRIL